MKLKNLFVCFLVIGSHQLILGSFDQNKVLGNTMKNALDRARMQQSDHKGMVVEIDLGNENKYGKFCPKNIDHVLFSLVHQNEQSEFEIHLDYFHKKITIRNTETLSLYDEKVIKIKDYEF